MRRIDEQYTRTPFYGIPRMTAWLRSQGYGINHKRVERLMQVMGIQAIYPKPHLSQNNPEHRVYPYLLRGVSVERVNQVWSTDITYVRLRQGFLYLVAILDWFSRYVLAWQLSNSLEVSFCLTALDEALEIAKPEIFNRGSGQSVYESRVYGQVGSGGHPHQYGWKRACLRQYLYRATLAQCQI